MFHSVEIILPPSMLVYSKSASVEGGAVDALLSKTISRGTLRLLGSVPSRLIACFGMSNTS